MLSTRTDSAEGAADDAAGECSMVAAAFVARDRSSRLCFRRPCGAVGGERAVFEAVMLIIGRIPIA